MRFLSLASVNTLDGAASVSGASLFYCQGRYVSSAPNPSSPCPDGNVHCTVTTSKLSRWRGNIYNLLFPPFSPAFPQNYTRLTRDGTFHQTAPRSSSRTQKAWCENLWFIEEDNISRFDSTVVRAWNIDSFKLLFPLLCVLRLRIVGWISFIQISITTLYHNSIPLFLFEL